MSEDALCIYDMSLDRIRHATQADLNDLDWFRDAAASLASSVRLCLEAPTAEDGQKALAVAYEGYLRMREDRGWAISLVREPCSKEEWARIRPGSQTGLNARFRYPVPPPLPRPVLESEA